MQQRGREPSGAKLDGSHAQVAGYRDLDQDMPMQASIVLHQSIAVAFQQGCERNITAQCAVEDSSSTPHSHS